MKKDRQLAFIQDDSVGHVISMDRVLAIYTFLGLGKYSKNKLFKNGNINEMSCVCKAGEMNLKSYIRAKITNNAGSQSK